MFALRESHREGSYRYPVTNSLFYPLSGFYEELGLPLPHLRRLEPFELPERERRLLVHDRDMTPTLEAASGGKLHLRVLKYTATEDSVSRLVTLVTDGHETPVEVGAIHIFLSRLPLAAQKAVVERRQPFGSILQENRVTHYSRPVAYFEVAADSVIMDALGMYHSRVLHGRRNTIWNSAGQELADVVEILPPSNNLWNWR